MYMDVRFTRHFWERYWRIARAVPKTQLKSLAEFLKREGVFYLSLDRGTLFVAVIGVVLVLVRDEGRWVIVSCYPGDWRLKYRMAFGKLEQVTFDELQSIEEDTYGS